MLTQSKLKLGRRKTWVQLPRSRLRLPSASDPITRSNSSISGAERREKRQKAEEALKKAEESGDLEEQDKQQKRLVRAGTKESEDCIRLLEMMGVEKCHRFLVVHQASTRVPLAVLEACRGGP